MRNPPIAIIISAMPERIFKVAVIVPVYNHCTTVGTVIRDLTGHFPNQLLVVINDGSTDATADALAHACASVPNARITVCTHPRNRGKGAALLTGLRAASDAGCTHALTVDADGQHIMADAIRLVAIARLFPDDLIIGDRQLDRFAVPVNSRRGRDMSRFWLWLQIGFDIPDPQCGLRVYPLPAALEVRCLTRRYDFETEIAARAAWRGITIRSAAITCIYFPPGQRITHFRPLMDTIRGTWINIILTTARILSLPPGRMAPAPASSDVSLYSWLRNRNNWRSLLNLNGCGAITSSLSAAAVGIGVLIAFIPLYGLQTILAIYIAQRLHLNVPLMVLATQISIPPLSVGIILISMVAGHLMLHGALPPITVHAIEQHSMWHWISAFTVDLLVGGLICGLAAGTLALLATRLAYRCYCPRPNAPAGAEHG